MQVCRCASTRNKFSSIDYLITGLVVAHLTVLSADPDAAYCALQVRAADKTLSVCPSNVFITPVLLRSHVLRVLSHEEDKMHTSCVPVSRFLVMTVAMQETTSRCPSIVTRRGPPGKLNEGWRGVITGGKSSKAVMTSCFRTDLKSKDDRQGCIC